MNHNSILTYCLHIFVINYYNKNVIIETFHTKHIFGSAVHIRQIQTLFTLHLHPATLTDHYIIFMYLKNFRKLLHIELICSFICPEAQTLLPK
jgi:hypothetical protein